MGDIRGIAIYTHTYCTIIEHMCYTLERDVEGTAVYGYTHSTIIEHMCYTPSMAIRNGFMPE